MYRGNFQPEVPLADRWSTEHQIALTMEAMGVRVIRAQEIRDEAWSWRRAVDAAVYAEADLFLWTQTWNIEPEEGFRALDDLRSADVPTASFHLDLYWGLDRQVQMLEQPFWRTDMCFTADGGHDAAFARAGINHRWLPPAIFADHAVVGSRVDALARFPVIFVGSYPYPHREHAEARRDLVQCLQSWFGSKFRVYNGNIRGRDLCDLYATATVVVGDSCFAGKLPRYWSDRIPETLGRAGFLIHPYVEGIEDSFVDGEHLRLFEPSDLGQLHGLVTHYLDHPDEAAEIGLAGRQAVLAGHTYRHRILAVFDAMGVPIPESPGV